MIACNTAPGRCSEEAEHVWGHSPPLQPSLKSPPTFSPPSHRGCRGGDADALESAESYWPPSSTKAATASNEPFFRKPCSGARLSLDGATVTAVASVAAAKTIPLRSPQREHDEVDHDTNLSTPKVVNGKGYNENGEPKVAAPPSLPRNHAAMPEYGAKGTVDGPAVGVAEDHRPSAINADGEAATARDLAGHLQGDCKNNHERQQRQGSSNKFNDLWDEAQHYLSLSMLVYIYAKLREMAILGYTETDFRAIDVNSIRTWKPSPTSQPSWPTLMPRQGPSMQQQRRISLNRVYENKSMCMPMPPLRRRRSMSDGDLCDAHDLDDWEKREQRNSFRPSPPSAKPSVDVSDGTESIASVSSMTSVSSRGTHASAASGGTYAPVGYPLTTKMVRSILRVVLVELEHEIRQGDGNGDSNVEGDSEGEDYGERHRFNSDHDTCIVKEFRKWVDDSRTDKLNDMAEQAILELRRKATMSVQLSRSHVSMSSDRGSSEHGQRTARSSIRASLSKRRGSLLETNSVKGDWLVLQKRLIEDHFGISDGINDLTLQDGSVLEPNDTEAAMESQKLTEKGVTKNMIEEVLAQSLPAYFKKGSVLNKMVDSGVEVAWFGDRHPNEAIYCICICRKTNTVTVVFRGSVTTHNWLHNMKLMMSKQPNPVANESYEGRMEHVKLHTGFGLYMLRRRKDDGSRKLDEIFKKVHSIGRQLAPDGKYHLSVTGHSLGGALATIFSFYASADERFTSMAPVRVFTFAAPRVGDRSFADAYQHLERTGRVLHARFMNCRDIVPLVPMFSIDRMRIGPWYKHVGLQVKLHEANMLGKHRIRNSLDVLYSSEKSWWDMLFMSWKNNFISNINTIRGYGNTHILSTHQRRLNFARQYRLRLGQSEFSADSRRKSLKSLEEYYQIRANIPASAPCRRDANRRDGDKQTKVLILSLFLTCMLLPFLAKNFYCNRLLLMAEERGGNVSMIRANNEVQSKKEAVVEKHFSPYHDSKNRVGSANTAHMYHPAIMPLQSKKDDDCNTHPENAKPYGRSHAVIHSKPLRSTLSMQTHGGATAGEHDRRADEGEIAGPVLGSRIWGLRSTPLFLQSSRHSDEETIDLSDEVLVVAASRCGEVAALRARELWDAHQFACVFEGKKVAKQRAIQALKEFIVRSKMKTGRSV